MAPDRCLDAASKHVCYSLTPATGKLLFGFDVISPDIRELFEYFLYRKYLRS